MIARRLFGNFNILPECHIALDVRGSGFRIGIKPSGILGHPVIKLDVVVGRNSFPLAGSVLIAWLEIGAIEGARREINVTLDGLIFVCLGEHDSVPFGLGHDLQLIWRRKQGSVCLKNVGMLGREMILTFKNVLDKCNKQFT